MSDAKRSYRLNPILRVLLVGVYDKESPLSSLSSCLHIVQRIWNNVVEYWKLHITDKGKTYELGTQMKFHVIFGSASSRVEFKFPRPQQININMMPFKMSDSFKKSRLPNNVKPYWNFIEAIRGDQNDLLNKICYLTIHESRVNKNESQRRPGLHMETPGRLMISNEKDISTTRKGDGNMEETIMPNPDLSQVNWGGPAEVVCHRRYGGIYMASSVDQSCKIWDCQIVRDEETGQELIGEHGDIEHLREFLPVEPFLTEKNRIYWITDRTPHESLPMKEGTYRQFFRLVTDQVSVWFKDHSTENPNGVMPDPKITTIVSGSKFKGDLKVVDPDTVLATVIKKISKIFK